MCFRFVAVVDGWSFAKKKRKKIKSYLNSFVRNFSQFAVVYFRLRDFGQVAAAAAVATHWHKYFSSHRYIDLDLNNRQQQ